MPITSAISARDRPSQTSSITISRSTGLSRRTASVTSLSPSTLDHDEHRVGGGHHPEVGELRVETSPSIKGSRLIRQHFASDAVETRDSLWGPAESRRCAARRPGTFRRTRPPHRPTRRVAGNRPTPDAGACARSTRRTRPLVCLRCHCPLVSARGGSLARFFYRSGVMGRGSPDTNGLPEHRSGDPEGKERAGSAPAHLDNEAGARPTKTLTYRPGGRGPCSLGRPACSRWRHANVSGGDPMRVSPDHAPAPFQGRRWPRPRSSPPCHRAGGGRRRRLLPCGSRARDCPRSKRRCRRSCCTRSLHSSRLVTMRVSCPPTIHR